MLVVDEPIVYDGFNQQIKADSSTCGTITRNVGADLKRNGQGIIEPVIIEDFYKNRGNRYYEEECPTIRADREGLKVAEPISTRGSEVASTLRASMFKQGERNLVENIKNGRGYEGIIEPCCVASRGRNPQGGEYQQNLEINSTGTKNSLTTVQKDNMVLEPTIWGSKQEHCAVKKDGICPTLTQAMGAGGGQIPMHNYNYRVRKLTEKECFRLQGVKDKDFAKIRKNQSKSSCYHLAGDSISSSVLMALFGEMLDIDWREKVEDLVEELQDKKS